MSSEPSPSLPTGKGVRSNSITASLVNPGPNALFQLTYRGETVTLNDSTSLNRWAAIGIVERHKVSMSHAGVNIDGHQIQYSDPDAIEHLERVLNRPQAPAQPARPARSGAAAPGKPAGPTSEAAYAESLANRLRVTREGFEFHVVFPTRFGETKTEKLERALEVLQNMRVFKPHINLQKSGIRLVVTRWDGENFIEEPGIDNVEHASPEQLEALIRSNLIGGTERPLSGVARHGSAARSAVARVEVVKRPHDARFHLVLHRGDGVVEDGAVLIRGNMSKLSGDAMFRPGVALSMTAMNDRITVTRKADVGGQNVLQSETLALTTLEDAKRVEEILNQCLRAMGDSETAVQTLEQALATTPTVDPPERPAPTVEPEQTPESIPAHSRSQETAVPVPVPRPEPRELGHAEEGSVPPVEREEPVAVAVPEKAELPPQPYNWVKAALSKSTGLDQDEINAQVFDALRIHFEQPIARNDHDFPAFQVALPGPESNSVTLEFVLTPHYLLCTTAFGYLRFGPETRLFLTRLDDYLAFPQHALRGVIRREGKSGVAFVVSTEFDKYLRTYSDRSYRVQFADFLASVDQVTADEDLLWPVSDEEQLFELLAATARNYGLPVTPASVVLDPSASEFVGFAKVASHGLEFRNGDDYVRFTPALVEFAEEGQSQQIPASRVLRGWALDGEGRVCALYRQSSGFVPPADPKLLRFLSEENNDAALNVLGILPQSDPSSLVTSGPADR